MTHCSNSAPLRLVGGIRIGASPPGDYSFYGNLFGRLAKETKHTGDLTRHVAFDTLAEQAITFLGIEVEAIQNIPEGMIAWELSESSLSVFEPGARHPVWQADVDWQWRNQSTDHCGVTGAFSIEGPPEWSQATSCQTFSITANAYVAPEKTGPDDSIELVAYDDDWPRQYKEFAGWLGQKLGPKIALKIEHFGSTAIPGLIAKPIIDVLVEVPSFSAARQKAIPLLNDPAWEYWWYDNHMTFIKRDRFLGHRTHHVHMMTAGPEARKRLAFRNYLRSHKKDALRYASLKTRLAASYPNEREKYTEEKAAFANDIAAKTASFR